MTRLACLFLFLFFGPSVSSAFWANKNCVKGAEITTTKLCNKETNGNGNDSTELKNFHLKGMCEEKNKLLIFLSPLHKVPWSGTTKIVIIFRMPCHKICCRTMCIKESNTREAYQVIQIILCYTNCLVWKVLRCLVFLKTDQSVIYPSEWFIRDFLKFWWLDVSLPDDNAYDGWKDYQPICRERESFSKMWSTTNGTMMCDSGELLVLGYPSSEIYPKFGGFLLLSKSKILWFFETVAMGRVTPVSSFLQRTNWPTDCSKKLTNWKRNPQTHGLFQ